MRLSTRSQSYLCLPCQLKTGRLALATNPPRHALWTSRAGFSSSQVSRSEISSARKSSQDDGAAIAPFTSGFSQTVGSADQKNNANEDNVVSGSRTRPQPTTAPSQGGHRPVIPRRVVSEHGSRSRRRRHAISLSSAVELTEAQQQELHVVHTLKERLSRGLGSISEIKENLSIANGISIDEILKTLPPDGHSPTQKKVISSLGTNFNGQSFSDVKSELDVASAHRSPQQKYVTDPKTKDVLFRLGVIENGSNETQPAIRTKGVSPGNSTRRPSLADMVASPPTAHKRMPARNTRPGSKPVALQPRTGKSDTQTVEAKDLVLSSIDAGEKGHLPQLSFDLSRVLFNPGVYHLRDPRSRVYNFDPYLENLMPVTDFKFESLNPYLTSSEDEALLDLARNHEKRYIGSSSSMTAVLSQFHFLLSNWRPLNFGHFTRSFGENSTSSTALSRSPAAIFLRHRNGTYAVDADKEYDEPNVLMGFGHMMEKLLTSERPEFEKWSKKHSASNSESVPTHPEAFHYSEQGRFLLRSQLDVHDPRLPGTGYFDLKTRAVAGIRMNMREHEVGMGYQIKERFGTWESYEREYYDMARSTFLKYSLQARMGHMDGIFVAYHNIARIFGFQYVPISEMDLILHGQSDPCLGDQEFRFSINFLEEIFNMGTTEYPGRSLRIHFESREGTLTEQKPFMNIYIEPMTEDNIKAIQNSQKAQFDSFERRILRGEEPGPLVDVEGEIENKVTETAASEQADALEEDQKEKSPLPVDADMAGPAGPSSNAANTDFLNSVLNTKAARTRPEHDLLEIMALKLTVQTRVNDRPLSAPNSIGPSARWALDYTLERRSDELAGKLYRQCRSRRMAALKTVINRGPDDYFVRSIREMSEKGAEWRRQQDDLDADREPVVLYGKQQ